MMNAKTKTILKSAIFSGLGFACIMAVFEYVDRTDFNPWKFLFGFFFLGIAMGLSRRYSLKKEAEKLKNESAPYHDRNDYPTQ